MTKNRNNWVRFILVISICLSGFIPPFFIIISFSLFALVLLETLYLIEQLVLRIRTSRKDFLAFLLSVVELVYYLTIIDYIHLPFDDKLLLLLLALLVDIILSKGRGAYIVRNLDKISYKTIEKRKEIFLKTFLVIFFLVLSNVITFLIFNFLNDVIFIIFFILGLALVFYGHVLKLLPHSYSSFVKNLVLVVSTFILYMPLLMINLSFFKPRCFSMLIYFVYILSYAIIWHIISIEFYKELTKHRN